MKKTLSIIAVFIILIIAALSVTIKIYLTPERIRAFLVPSAEKALNRKINIGKVKISLFKGIEAHNFSIKEADGKTDFLKSKEFVLKYQLIPLLSKTIVIDELKIISPEIRLVRSSEGQFNFEDIGKQTDGQDSGEQRDNKDYTEAETPPVSLLVSKLVISDAKFRLKDHKKELPEIEGSLDINAGISGSDSTGLLSMGKINLKLNKIVKNEKNYKNIDTDLDYEVSINLKSDSIKIKKADLTLNDITAAITGDITGLKSSPDISVILAIPETNTETITEMANQFVDMSKIKLSGDLSAYIKLMVNPAKPDYALMAEGMIGLNKINTVYEGNNAAIDGKLHFRYKPHNLHLDKSDLVIQQIPVSIKGDVLDLHETPKINLGLTIFRSSASNLLSAASPYIDTKDMSLSGEIKADLKLKGIPAKTKTLKADGSISLLSVGVRYKDLNATINSEISLKSNDIHIKKSGLKIEEIPLSLSGTVINIMAEPLIDLSLSIPEISASKIQKLAGTFTELKDLSLSGRLGADIRLRGRPDKIKTLKANGKVQIEQVRIKHDNINALVDGTVTINDKSMNINIWASSGKNTVLLKGTIASYFENQDINLNLYSKTLYLDNLPSSSPKSDAGSSSKSKKTVKQKSSTSSAEEPKPLDLKIMARGEIKVRSAVYKEMEMKNFYLKYLFKDNKLSISKMTADSGGGKIRLASDIDLSKPGYRYALSGTVDSFPANPLVNSFLPRSRNTVFGLLSANIKLDGQGTQPASLKKHLAGRADFKLIDGKITNNKATKKLADLVGIKELETIELKKAEGRANLKNGYATLKSIFISDDLTMDPSGKIGLDETLDLNFDLKLSPRLTKKSIGSDISKYMVDENDWGVIPVIISGTFSKPSESINTEKAVKRAASKAIKDLFKKKKKDSTKDGKQDLLKDLPVGEILEGIFGPK